MKIIVCGSMKFIEEIKKIKDKLTDLGHEVTIPNLGNLEKEQQMEDHKAKIEFDLIRLFFKKIENSDALLVANFDKNNIKGYIGGNSLLEMGKAYDVRIPIYLLNEIPEMLYTEEIKALQPIVLNSNLNKIKNN
jgi:hypothetical protein